jgi:serine/threonine protein kinase
LGVLTYEFLVGNPPFETEDEQQTYERIKKVDVRYPTWMEPCAKDFISKLLMKDPASRMPLSEVPNHEFIQTFAQN